MGRGYSREAYLDLVDHVRTVVPGVSISSDFISGFCGETEEDHRETISLMEQVRYDQVGDGLAVLFWCVVICFEPEKKVSAQLEN